VTYWRSSVHLRCIPAYIHIRSYLWCYRRWLSGDNLRYLLHTRWYLRHHSVNHSLQIKWHVMQQILLCRVVSTA